MSGEGERLQEEPPGRQGLASRKFKVDAALLTWVAVAIGVVLRVVTYAGNREIYLDEQSLLNNLVGKPVFDIWTTLSDHQLAPPGFLIIERLMVRLPLPVVPTARFVPLLCAIASMFLMRKVALRYLEPRAVPVAVAFFALCDYLVYYASEIKQYGSDVVLTLLAFLVAAPVSRGEPSNPRRLAEFAAFGVVAPWFSFPITLVLGAIGIQWIVSQAVQRQWGKTLKACAICLGWGVSFAVCYKISQHLLRTRQPRTIDPTERPNSRRE